MEVCSPITLAVVLFLVLVLVIVLVLVVVVVVVGSPGLKGFPPFARAPYARCGASPASDRRDSHLETESYDH